MDDQSYYSDDDDVSYYSEYDDSDDGADSAELSASEKSEEVAYACDTEHNLNILGGSTDSMAPSARTKLTTEESV